MTTTRISERGQVVIPKEIRGQLGLERGQVLEVEEWEGAILMRPRMCRRVVAQQADGVHGAAR